MSFSARLLVLIAALLPSAGATTITVLPAVSVTETTAERNSWLIQNFGPGTTATPVETDIRDITPGNSNGVVRLELLTAFHSLYFVMSGVYANVQIQTADGTTAHVNDRDSSLYFVGITSPTTIGYVEWQGHGDFRLTDFGTPQGPGSNPEPATWLCIATGLAAISRALSRQSLRRPTS